MRHYRRLYERIYDYENLYWAYREARRGKRYRPEVLAFGNRLEENLIQIQNELVWRTYRQSPYHEFYVQEPKRRLIMALPFRDRVVHWAVYRVLAPILERKHIYDSYACRPGRGTHAALGRVVDWLRADGANRWYVLKLDVHRYFYRINHDTLLGLYRRWIDDESLMWLLETIIRAGDGLLGVPDGATDYGVRAPGVGMAVGNLVSQMSANVYLNELDQFAKHTLRLRRYARYMDDVLAFSESKAELHRARAAMEEFLETRLALRVNGKTQIRPVRQGVEWVGYRVFPSHVLLRKSTAMRMKRRLRSLSRAYGRGEASVETVRQAVRSYVGIMSHADTWRLRTKLFESVSFRREVDEGGPVSG